MSEFQFKSWPTLYKKITQRFGANPQNYAQFGLPGHEGVDIRAPSGTPIMSVADGFVYRVHQDPNSHNYGLHVRIRHEGGYQTVYAHLQEIHVQENDSVAAGSVIGLADNTGNSFGSHLHLTLKKDGVHVPGWPKGIIDPTPFLLPLMGWQRPREPYLSGWVSQYSVSISGDLAQANDDITLRISPEDNILIPLGTIMVVEQDNHEHFLKVQVSRAAVGLDSITVPTKPSPLPPHNILLYYGWIRADHINRVGNRGIIITAHGATLRTDSAPYTHAIGLIRQGGTVYIVGRPENEYLPVKVPRIALRGSVNPTEALPSLPLDYIENLPDSVFWGWISKQKATSEGLDITVSHYGATLRSAPNRLGAHIANIYGDAPALQIGWDQNDFLPIMIGHQNLVQIAPSIPNRQEPDLFTAEDVDNLQTSTSTLPAHTTLGWAFSASLDILDPTHAAASTDLEGINLRASPQRNSPFVGFVPAKTELFIANDPQGEFTPVRVNTDFLQTARPEIEKSEFPLLGEARIGLHASADPHISEAEHAEFAKLRPGIIKALSFHPPEDIRRLSQAHPRATWIVRAFLDFGDRYITPQQFLRDTLSDVQRTLDAIHTQRVVIELHNEPNISPEGLYTNWSDGEEFQEWWLELLALYRQALPDRQFIFPGLSPGSSVSNFKIDHIQFIEACRAAVTAADGLGLHLYWSHIYPISRTLDVLDDYISRFRNIPIWITEASNNKGHVTAQQKAQEYLLFWKELQNRPIVQGVTYFVASASNPDFREEIWVGRGIGQIVGQR